jgi:hypothetical protein
VAAVNKTTSWMAGLVPCRAASRSTAMQVPPNVTADHSNQRPPTDWPLRRRAQCAPARSACWGLTIDERVPGSKGRCHRPHAVAVPGTDNSTGTVICRSIRLVSHL